MLLTLSNPVKADFEFKPHDYSPAFSSSTAARFSPRLNGGRRNSQAASSSYAMGTPHRGLPPPSAMTLPDPGRGPPPIQSTLGAMPAAPSQWQGAEDGMKNWLAAKAEEERRKQEEEKTRQETLRLEQRKIEQSMLRESMQGGIPPHLVPIIFAGIGGGNLANISAEWIQQYTARDTRLIGQPPSTVYSGQPPTPQTVLPDLVLPGQPLPPQAQHAPSLEQATLAGPVVTTRKSCATVWPRWAPTSAPRPPPQSQLPRLTTNEMNIQQPPAAPSGVQQLQQTQTAQQEQSSPSIYFHHWVPPSASSQQEKSSSGNPPATPSGKYKTSPVYQPRQRATSHASDLEYTSSPKKRKAQGQHQPAPLPTSAPQSYTSPSFSHISTSSTSTPGRRGHGRARSDASTRGPEGSSGSLSRREEPRVAEGKPLPNSDPAHATPPHRNDGRLQGQQNYAPTSIPSQPETPKYGPQDQHWDGRYMSSPKREVGDH
ncbi:hypothetical protein BKA66DRAFT_515534 [Pyrenochaeta sp. MPI-SDFR-AT-0127]|nr:hypothetical protein BKA66DRAFT_515534 [Pyrenochaeta sp. MPI-SDFR-AT-0127]